MVHPGFNPFPYHHEFDVGLIKLKDPITEFTSTISPACLPLNVSREEIYHQKAAIRYHI